MLHGYSRVRVRATKRAAWVEGEVHTGVVMRGVCNAGFTSLKRFGYVMYVVPAQVNRRSASRGKRYA